MGCLNEVLKQAGLGIIYKTINIPIDIQAVWNVTLDDKCPPRLYSGEFSNFKITSPVGNEMVYAHKQSTPGVPVVDQIIVTRDPIILESLYNISNVLIKSHIKSPFGSAHIL